MLKNIAVVLGYALVASIAFSLVWIIVDHPGGSLDILGTFAGRLGLTWSIISAGLFSVLIGTLLGEKLIEIYIRLFH